MLNRGKEEEIGRGLLEEIGMIIRVCVDNWVAQEMKAPPKMEGDSDLIILKKEVVTHICHLIMAWIFQFQHL